jgi:hypothetical protein
MYRLSSGLKEKRTTTATNWSCYHNNMNETYFMCQHIPVSAAIMGKFYTNCTLERLYVCSYVRERSKVQTVLPRIMQDFDVSNAEFQTPTFSKSFSSRCSALIQLKPGCIEILRFKGQIKIKHCCCFFCHSLS